ncbi:MAG: helix-turn-helix domain-containing protein [Halolamina sp.]
MARAKLSVRLPPETWVGETTRAYPDAEVRVHSVIPSDDGGVALAEVRADAPDDFLADAAAHDGLADLDVAEVAASRALVTLTTRHSMVLSSLQEAGVPADLPVVAQGGRVVVEVTAPRSRLSALGDHLSERSLSFDVEYIRGDAETETPLTSGQRELLALALSEGYYETPRRCTLTELAAVADVAKSTASERLHRAESAVVRWFAAESAAMDDP